MINNDVFSGTKMEPIFYHYLDDIAIKIIDLGYDTFVWIQYGPTEGGQSVDVMKQYTLEEIKPMVELLQPCGSIPAIDMFDNYFLSGKIV